MRNRIYRTKKEAELKSLNAISRAEYTFLFTLCMRLSGKFRNRLVWSKTNSSERDNLKMT